MTQHFVKDHKGGLPSPVAGMNMASWLSHARMTEGKLETFLARTDLDPIQRTKMEVLLHKVRVDIREQLEKLNEAPPPKP